MKKLTLIIAVLCVCGCKEEPKEQVDTQWCLEHELNEMNSEQFRQCLNVKMKADMKRNAKEPSESEKIAEINYEWCQKYPEESMTQEQFNKCLQVEAKYMEEKAREAISKKRREMGLSE